MAEGNINSRLETFCDGVFAIALTVLIIDIKIPSTPEINTVADFLFALKRILPSIGAFVLSFIIIMITWYNHHQAFRPIKKSSPSFVYANGLLLLSVVFLPFPTSLLGEYVLTDHAAPAVALFSFTIVAQSLSWILLFTAVLNHNLVYNEKAIALMRQSRRYGMYSIIVYSLLGIMAIWFPHIVAIMTVLLWLFWLWYGVTIKPEEID